MAYYVIYGADQMYDDGKYQLIQADLDSQAEEDAMELSREVIEDSQMIINDLEDDLREWCDEAHVAYPDGGYQLADMRDEVYSNDVLYEVWEVKPTDKSFKELKQIFDRDPKEFIDDYCEN